MNLWMTGAGTALFGVVLAILLLAPQAFDRAARGFAVAEVSDRLDAALPGLVRGGEDMAIRLRSRLPDEVQEQLSSLADRSSPAMEALVARVLAEVCACDDGPPIDVAPGFAALRADLAAAEERIAGFARAEFDAVIDQVRRDVTIFAGTTFALFLAALLLAASKGRASAHLLPISTILTVTTLVMAAWYLLGQDWLLTVIVSDYWGMGYPVAAAFLGGILLDIALFRARVTTWLLNALGGIPLSPC